MYIDFPPNIELNHYMKMIKETPKQEFIQPTKEEIQESMRKILDEQFKNRRFFRLPVYENWSDAFKGLPKRRPGE